MAEITLRDATKKLRELSKERNEPSYITKLDDHLCWLYKIKEENEKRSENEQISNITLKEEISKETSDKREALISYKEFLQTGDYHYFVSRILFMNRIVEYGFFSAHQCIENYLKGYLKFINQNFPHHHDLTKILETCRKFAPDSHLFIHSIQCQVVIDRFDPFYELARYPVQIKSRPKKGVFGHMYPDDIGVLDYFIFRMKEIMPLDEKGWNILKKGHFLLFNCQRDSPSLYSLFLVGNINFGNSFNLHS